MAINKLNIPGPLAREVLARDATTISPSYPRDYPVVMDHGRGSYVSDVEGNPLSIGRQASPPVPRAIATPMPAA